MAMHDLERWDEYLDYLRAHPPEVDALERDLLINVTSFFRDPTTFDTLKSRVLPTILAQKSSGLPIRIWVAGCSTGEEAYSIGICLLEYLNVLIYLGAELQKRIIPIFHYALKPNSFLMLGTSESIGDFADLFALVDKKSKIYERKSAPRSPYLRFNSSDRNATHLILTLPVS
jgi:chemotaxis methyl-accepting protein methylase